LEETRKKTGVPTRSRGLDPYEIRARHATVIPAGLVV